MLWRRLQEKKRRNRDSVAAAMHKLRSLEQEKVKATEIASEAKKAFESGQ